MDEQLLKDFLATAQADQYDWEVIMPKFPELADVDLQVLKDYAETAKQNNYDYAITNPLFPELFPQDPLKKKDVTESSGENGSLVSPTITNTSTQTTDASMLEQNALQAGTQSGTTVSTLTPPPSVPQTQGTDSITPELMTYEEEFVVPQLNYEYGNQGFIFEESGAFGDSMKVTAENGETLDVNLDVFLDSTKTKEAAALKDFIVKNKTRRGLNQMESEYISAQKKFYNEEEVNTAVTKIGEQTLGYVKQVQEYLADKAKLDEEMQALSSLTAQQRSSKGKEISAVMERSKELRELKKQLLKGQSVLVNNERNLKVAAGKYFDMLAEQGTVGGASYNRILKGIGRISAGATSYAVDALVSALPYAGMNPVEYRQMFVDIAREKGLEVPENFKDMTEDELKEFYSEVARTEELTTQSTTGQTIKVGEKKITFGEDIEAAVYDKGKKTVKFSDDVGLGEGQGLLEAIRTGAPTLLGDKSVSEQYDQLMSEGFWGGAWLGLMESIPAMLAPGGAAGMAARTAMMFSQVSDHYDEEMENNPAFKDITENERAAFKLPVGMIIGALEAIGVRNALRQSPFLNKLLLRIAGKTPKNVTGKTFNDIVRNEINNMFAKGTIVVTAGGLAEFETGALQEVADISAKKVYNAFKEKEMFVTPESFSEGVSQVLVAGAQEAVGGFVIGTPGAIVAAATTQDFTQVDDATFEMFEILTSQDNSSKFTYADYKNKVANPNDKMTKEDAEAEIALFEEVQGLVKQIPTDLSTEQKKKALGLMLNRKQLEDSKAGKDSSLTQNIDKKIGEIDQQLNNILFTKEAESVADAIPEMEKNETEVKGSLDPNGLTNEEKSSNRNRYESYSSENMEVNMFVEDEQGQSSTRKENDYRYGVRVNKRRSDNNQMQRVESLTQYFKTPEKAKAYAEKIIAKDTKSALKTPTIKTELEEEKGTVIDKGKLSEEQQDIDSFFGEEVEETTETVQSNLSINRAGDVTEKSPETISRENVVIKLAKLGAKSISTLLPNTRIILHESNQEFEKYAAPGRGELIGDTIHINLSKATSTTVPHEIFHAVFLNKIKTDPRAAEIAEGMMKAVRKTLPDNSDLAKRIDAFADLYKDVSELQNEERLAELIGIMASEYKTLSKPQKNIVVKFIEDLARALGIDVNISEFTKTDADVIDLLNTLATKVGTGEEITEVDVEILEDGTNPVGDPTEIRVPKPRQQINFKDSYPLSLVAAQNKIDILSLIKNINSKKEKVWFWVADQLGIGEVNGILLDAGPSFALEGDAVWASSAPVSKIEKNISIADYLFIISGSPERSLLFNKKVYDVFIENLGEYSTFKSQALATNPVKNIRETLDEFNSWDDLRNSPKRKVFLNAVVDQATKPNTDFHKLINTLGGFIDVNDLRDGFYKENNFSINDVMLVLKPTGVREGSKHSTYKNEVLGEIVGVPDAKVNAFEIMPLEMVNKYKRQLSVAEQSQIVAPYGSGIREIRQPRQQRSIEDVTRLFNMNDRGFIPKTANLSELRKAVEAFGFKAFKSREDRFGRGGDLFIKQPGKPRYEPKLPGRRQQRSVIDYVNEGRDAGFRDELIIDYLRRVRRLKMKDIKKVMDIPAGVTMSLPESFKNIKGGAVAGLKLFKKIEAFRDKERKLNKRRKNKLSEAEIMTKAIEFLQSQPEYKNEGDTFVSKGKVRFKTGISTQQVLLENDLQKTLDQRPTQDMARRLKLARAMVTQRVKGKRDLQAIKKEVRSFIRKTLPVDMYRLSEVKSLINEVTEATEENIENVLDKVLDLATTKNNKSLDSKIKKLLNNDFITNRFGRKVGKSVDQSTRDRLVAIKKALANKNATEEEIDKINESLNKQFNKLLLDPDPSQDVVNKMIDLQIAININNAQKLEDTNVYKTEALDSALVELVGLVGQGRTLLQQELDKSAKGYRDQMSKVYEAITGQKIDLEADDAKEILEKQTNVRISEREKNEVQKRIGTSIKNIFSKIEEYIFGGAEAIDGLMDRIDKLPGNVFGGVTQRLVTDKVDSSTRVYKERMLGFETLLRETLREFYGKNWESKSRKFRSKKFEFKDSNDISRRYTQDQMYYLYNQYKDPASRAAFENMFGKDYARVMKDIENKLEPEVKRFADWQVDVYFPMVYSHYNKTYQKIYRTNMPWNQFYAGRIYRDGITPEPLDLLANSTVYNTAASAASTLLRQNSKAKILPMNGTDALVTYTKDMEYFAAYAETVRDINKIFDNEYIKSAIREIHGDFTLTLIQDMIKKVAAKGIQDSKVAQLLNTMNTAFIFARLGLSPVIMIKQLTSIPTYAADIGVVNWLKYAAKNKTEQIKLWKEVRDNSVYMQDRRNNSILRQIESYSESSKSGFLPQKGLVWAEDFLMWTTKFGDRMAIMLGGLPNYSYYKAEFKKKNPNATEQEAIDHAIIKFERDTKRTQQSSDLQDKDYTQSSAFRSFNMFMTTPKQYLRKEIRSTRNLMRKLKAMDLKAGKGSFQQNAASLLTYHIFMPMLFQYVTNGMPGLLSDWDDEDSSDLLRAAVIGNLNALIIAGEIITNIGESIQGKPWAKELTAIPLYDVINELKNKVFGFIDAKTPPKQEKAAYELMEAIAITIGVPAYQVKKALNNYPKLNESKDYGELILRLLNYSDYQISGPAKKNTRNKKKNKMTQREMKLLFPDLYKDMQELQNPSEIKELEKELRELEKEMLEDLYK